MKIRFYSPLLLLLGLLSGTLTYAQTAGNKGKVSLFFEKVYLHTDRELYASGEDIWFKAYLVNAQNNYLTSNSSNLYVELISPDNEVIDREVLKLEGGAGFGDFKLKDSIPEGKYHIRAYTKWMLNYGDKFVFEREIQIHSIVGLKPKQQGEKIETKASIRFMPEGGSLVDSIESIIAFKAVDAKGNGCHVKGSLVNIKGDTLAWFEDQYLGMGQLQFMPEPGQKYFAVGTIDGKPFKTDFPASLAKGYVINVSKADTLFVVRIFTNRVTLIENAANELILQGQSYGKPCYGAKFKIAKLRTTIPVPQSGFRPGIALFTLYETQPATRPFCERLIYLEGKGKEKQTLTITTNKPAYGARDSITIHIKATDQLNQPVKANLSLAALDADLIPQGEHSISSYLFLESEIKGKIENPAAYFDPSNNKRAYTLDMLLLTQGWRDFLWKQMADTMPKIKIKNLMEQGFYVKGRVREILRDKPIPLAKVTLSISGAKKYGFQFMNTDSIGNFFFDLGAEFYGTKPLKITAKKFNKISGFIVNAGEVLMDSIWVDPPKIPYKIPFQPDMADNRFSSEANSRNLLMKKYKLSDTIVLNEMTIKANKGKADEQMGMFLVNGSTPDMDIKITEDDNSYADIGMFLLNKLPAAEYVSTQEGQRVKIKGHTGTLVSPRYILDNRLGGSDTAIMEEEVYNLMMDQIDRILISKQDLINGDLDRYVIAVYTKPGSREKKNFSVLSISVKGYYESRIFYAPNYRTEKTMRPDMRTTIFWAPKVITDENGEATVRYFNADKKMPVRVVVEGISNNGVPVTGSTIYKMQ